MKTPIYLNLFLGVICLQAEALAGCRDTIPKNYALFFACEEYRDQRLSRLQNPVKNAREIALELETSYGFQTEVAVNPVLDTVANKLEEYKQKFASGEYDSTGQLLVFFSGHGEEERENKNGYFLPVDASPDQLFRTAVAYSYWGPFISNINCSHILVAVDACFSGTFDPEWYNRSRNFARPKELTDAQRILAAHKRYKSRLFLTSATDVETPDNSRFAKKFLEGLRGHGGPDGILTYSELLALLDAATPRPHRGEFGGDEAGSNFLFISSAGPQGGTGPNPPPPVASEEDILWQLALEQDELPFYQAYIGRYPQGKYSKEARQAFNRLSSIDSLQAPDKREQPSIDSLAESLNLPIGQQQKTDGPGSSAIPESQEDVIWRLAREQNTLPFFRVYLERYPQGPHSDEARQAIGALSSIADLDNMAFVAGGTFAMGCASGDCEKDELPLRQVRVDSFWIGIHEVTFDAYDAFCDSTGRERPQDKGWGRGDLPVINVSWYDAVEYCNWLSREHAYREVYTINKEKQDAGNLNPLDDKKWIVGIDTSANGYRLPTEAEWEYAARSGGKEMLYAGASSPDGLADYANFCDSNCSRKVKDKNDGFEHTAPVGSLKPNDLGLHDMSGNVYEWCWDWYAAGEYGENSRATNPLGPASGSWRVGRGGSWRNGPEDVRTANRYYYTPSYSYYNFGFRLAKNVD